MRSAAHRIGPWARLLTITAVVLCVLYAPNAKAAAPMCSPLAETVIAPPIVMPLKDSVLRAPPNCEGLIEGLLSAPAAPLQDAPVVMPPDAPLRAVPFSFHFAKQIPSERRPAQAAERAAPGSDLCRSVYRPPRG